MNAARNPHLRPDGIPRTELIRYSDARPTFIVGSVRSGTSAMMAALREGAGIRGFNEGVLANLLPGLLTSVRQHYATYQQKPTTMLGSVPEEFMTTGIMNVFGQAYMETMGPGRWLDKTPGGATIVAACPSLLEIFPNATFIFCKRRGIENILSRQRKFPGRDFAVYCEGWALAMSAWREVAPQLGAHTVEVDQREMAVDPEAVVQKVGDLLQLAAAERDGMRDALQTKRLEQTRPVQDNVAIGLEQTGWSEAEQKVFREICGPMMEAFGYSMDADRPAAASAAYRFFVPAVDGVVRRENVASRAACRALDATTIRFKPNAYGVPAAGIRHGMIEMQGLRHFSATLRSGGRGVRESGGLIFRFALERSADHTTAFSAEQTINPGPSLDWTLELPQLSGQHDAVLSVRPATEGAAGEPMSAVWIDARLT